MMLSLRSAVAGGWLAAVLLGGGSGVSVAQQDSAPVGVVSHVKVLSDRVPDVSSLEAWKRSFIKNSMTDQQKALAIFRSVAMFRYQDAPPIEFLHEGCVHDPIKTFNVYGYGMCCCASSNVEALARYLGLEARAWGINAHSVPEVFYDNAWHMFDTSLVNYFPKPDGQVAGVDEIVAAVKEWLDKHPEYRKNDAKLREFHQSGGWMGWKQGPSLLAACPFYDGTGWWPAKTHGWYSTMQEYDGTGNTPFVFEYGYSQGYEVNVQLRPGERLTRNWFHKGRHVNGVLNDGDAPGCLKEKVGQGPMAYLTQYGDLNAGRIGSGTLEYDVPLGGGGASTWALVAENVASTAQAAKPDSPLPSTGEGQGVRGDGDASDVKEHPEPALHVQDAARPGLLEIRMPTSYVYLDGQMSLVAAIGPGGGIEILFSDNHGLDWKRIAMLRKSGPQKIDLAKLVLRRYDYRLRFVLSGSGTGLDRLRLSHAIQCSQRALPTLAQGENTISFTAGPSQGTITIEGVSSGNAKDKNVSLADFHPILRDVSPEQYRVQDSPAEVAFSIATPGEMTRLRFGGHFRARDRADRWDVKVSFDGGRTFRRVDSYVGPTQGKCQYTSIDNIPVGTRDAVIQWRGEQHNTTCLFALRIDADYRQPHGGFRPVKITYLWKENGVDKQDVHVATQPAETYSIRCQARPEMKSIILELAE
jgi:hypothetical protein